MYGGMKTTNIYYYNAEYGINISYLGYFQFAYATKPVGWRPRNSAFNNGQ